MQGSDSNTSIAIAAGAGPVPVESELSLVSKASKLGLPGPSSCMTVHDAVDVMMMVTVGEGNRGLVEVT